MTEPVTTAAELRFPGNEPGKRVHCGACQRLGHCRLGIEADRFDGASGIFHVELRCPSDHEGGPQVAHGGWTASVLDEVLGLVPILHGGAAVTGRLEVVYIRPVPIERALVAQASLERRDGRRWYVNGELRLAATGAELARATGIWVERAPRHFERHQAWLAGEEAAAARSEPIPR